MLKMGRTCTLIEKYDSAVLEPFGDVGTFAPNLAPEHSINISGAGQHYLFSGQGSVEILRSRGGPGQPFLPGAGQGGAGRASLVEITVQHKSNFIVGQRCRNGKSWCPSI